jgi:ribbon-helix-helix CopG family protein
MRTTLTLDDDVAARLRRVRATRKASLKDVVNEALRQGLELMESPPARRQPYRTPSVSLGRCLLGGIDDVSEALALAEGGAFR